jgi:hypothetical protein
MLRDTGRSVRARAFGAVVLGLGLAAGCGRERPASPALRWRDHEIRALAGPGLFLALAPQPTADAILGPSQRPWTREPWEVLWAKEGVEARLPSSFLATPTGFLARGAGVFGTPTLVRAELVGEQLHLTDSGGAPLVLRIPGIAVAVTDGRPVVAVAKEIPAPSVLLGKAGEAVVVERGAVRLDGEVAFVFGADIRIGIDGNEAAQRALASRTGRAIVLHEGSVEPAVAGLGVAAIGALGEPLGAGVTDTSGHFRIAARPGAARLFTLLGAGRGSEVVVSSPSATVPLTPLGHLSVDVRDFATGRLLPVRLFLHGAGGTPEPNFGPHFRASGAGSIVDLAGGEFAAPLPAGTYRVLATHGPEWTLDDQTVTIGVGEHQRLRLFLRHVVPTPGLAACDFHVHSSAGFDSDVSVEDRVRTLAGVGIDFAAPTEHNVVGSYAAVTALGLEDRLGWAPAVEVTTDKPTQGHFNVFPYPFDEPPPWEHTTLGRLVSFVRGKAPDAIIQVNHPRLGGGMGYFDLIHLDLVTGRSREPFEDGFDTLEVYNGFDLAKRERVEAVLGEWLTLFDAGRRHVATGNSDSHTAQYSWAGFPRTYVEIAGDLEDRAGPPVAVTEVVQALRRGHATVTSGPLVDLRVGPRGEAGPGDTFVVDAPGSSAVSVRVHVRVRRAPWVDVRSVRLLWRGRPVRTWALPEQALQTAFVEGPLLARQEAAVALDTVVELPRALVDQGGSLVVVATGERNLSGVLPFLDGQPLGFTNPVRFLPTPPRSTTSPDE